MTLAELSNADTLCKRLLRSLLGCGHEPALALVYREEDDHLGVEEINEVNKGTNSFEVRLPRWRNAVDVYVDMEEKTGYAATLRLDRLPGTKNWQRHLGVNYRVLHVKGEKPVWPWV